MPKTESVEIEFDFKNRNTYFKPLERTVRGHFRLADVCEKDAMSFQNKIPTDIPGMILGVGSDGCYLKEPIHERPEIKAKIEKLGMQIEDQKQDFPAAEKDAWLFWMKRMVEDGKAKVKTGELPEKVNYEPPSRFSAPPRKGEARLKEIFQKDPRLALEYQRMTTEERKAWEEAVGV